MKRQFNQLHGLVTQREHFLLPFLRLTSLPGLCENHMCAHTQESPQSQFLHQTSRVEACSEISTRKSSFVPYPLESQTRFHWYEEFQVACSQRQNEQHRPARSSRADEVTDWSLGECPRGLVQEVAGVGLSTDKGAREQEGTKSPSAVCCSSHSSLFKC